MRALSDALPTGHRAMANPTLQLHFGCGRATPAVSHSHNWPSGRMQNFLFKIGQKSYFLPIKTPKLILTIEWYYRSMYCRSNAMIFFKMANLKAISSSATLNLLSSITIASLRTEPIDDSVQLINFLLFSQYCFLSHFTRQYPQLRCLSTQPLYSH